MCPQLRRRGRLDVLLATLAAGLGAAALGCSPLPSSPIVFRTKAPSSSLSHVTTESAAPGRVIARLQPGVSSSDVANSYSTTLLGEIPELRLVLLTTPSGSTEQAFLTRLSSDRRIEYAELDRAFQTAEGRQSTIAFSEANRTWQDVLDQGAFLRIGAAAAAKIVPPGEALVAILDTGIDLDHPDLSPVLSLPGIEPGVTTNPGDDRPQGVDTNGDGVVDGALGHGTHVAGIVHAIAPLARLLPVRVLDSDGVGYAFDIARGLVEAVLRGSVVANLSLGMGQSSAAVATALDYAIERGVVVVAPAGNEDLSEVEFPASYPSVIAVAGTDSLDRKATFSNYGAPVDIAAPAVGILSTFVGGGYASWSGTSMAAPFVSGTAALLYPAIGSRTPASAQEVESLLGGGAVSLAMIDPVYGKSMGAGRVSAIGSAGSFVPSSSSDETPDLTLWAR